MKKVFIHTAHTALFLFLFLTGRNAQAADGDPVIQFVESRITNGFYFGLTDKTGHTNTTVENTLCFAVWTTNASSTNTRYSAIFPTEPEYEYQLELLDEHGVPVAKTEAAKKIGSRFLDFNTNNFVLRATGPDVRIGPKAQLIQALNRAWPYQMLVMFCPSEVFKVERPGNYTLKIRFQIIAVSYPISEPHPHGRTELIRFEPLEFPLVKKQKPRS